MNERKPVEVFSPGEYIKDEIIARDWTQADLSDVLGRPPRLVNELISGKRGITPDTAKGLAGAFGTSAQFWMNLESMYRLGLTPGQPGVVERRALLYGKAPVRAMIKRNWIQESRDMDILEDHVCGFFKVSDIKEEFRFLPGAVRRSASRAGLTVEQNAWLFRSLHMAEEMEGSAFSKEKIDVLLKKLKPLLSNEGCVAEVPEVLKEAGIKFLIVEPLPKSRIDGATYWLGNEPVVVLSLRYDRIDYFWYTLMHEIGHVISGDGKKNEQVALDVDLAQGACREGSEPDREKKADDFASDFLIPRDVFDAWITRTGPAVSKRDIWNFSQSINVHPGIIAGRIHYREKNYSHFNEFITKVRRLLAAYALTDGWANVTGAMT